MSEIKELQAEEKEALQSIYEGDLCFHVTDDTKYQYKYGENDDIKSFLVEILWTDNYPNEFTASNVNMDTFYNRNISQSFKSKVVSIILQEAEVWLGCSMTFTLFECIKEKLPDLLEELTQETAQVNEIADNIKTLHIDSSDVIKTGNDPAGTKTEKKEQLTKAQKRRRWEQTDHKGNRARGWDWVDIIKHLSQTGYKDEQTVVAGTPNAAVITASH